MSRPGSLLLVSALLLFGACDPPLEEIDDSAAIRDEAKKLAESIKFLPQIEGGSAVSITTFPSFGFMALLEASSTPFCGGALIHEDWVLTAAHCAGNEWIILGRRDLETPDGERHAITEANSFCHKPHDSTSYENDIALIKLARTSVPGSVIKPVALVANASWETSSPPLKLMLAGWGKGSHSSELHQVSVDRHPNTRCAQAFSLPIQIPSTTFCTISPSGGARKRDSGGPVLINQGGLRLVGIMTAVGKDKSPDPGKPNRHVRITDYLDWITKVMSTPDPLTLPDVEKCQ